MTYHNMQSKDLLIGAAIGGLLGTVSALLIAPKSGQKLREDLCDTYCDIADRTQDFAKRGQKLARSLGNQTSSWAERARDVAAGVKDWVSPEEEEEHCTKDLLIGGIAGGILGAVAGLLLAPKPGEDLREDLADTYSKVSETTQDYASQFAKKGKKVARNVQSKASDWISIAQDVMEYLSDQAQDVGEEVAEKGKKAVHKGQDRINDMMEWASLGFRLWQGLKKRR